MAQARYSREHPIYQVRCAFRPCAELIENLCRVIAQKEVDGKEYHFHTGCFRLVCEEAANADVFLFELPCVNAQNAVRPEVLSGKD